MHIHHNNFYDNALGFTTDVFTAAGHPGFPQDSDLVENNNFYSNNFNPYVKGSDVEPSIPVPVGTGLWIAGGNHNIIRNNRFWDNWRRGTMLFAVPDSTVCAPPEHQAGCDPAKVSTSFNNETYGNVMGRDPRGRRDPNGTDFWWDNFAGNTGNCWHDNTGKEGTAASVTSTPELAAHRLRLERQHGHRRPGAGGRARLLPGRLLGPAGSHRLVSLVHHARRASVAAALVAGLALSGCLGGTSSGDRPASAGARIGTPLQLANCRDWRKATPPERQGTVRDLRGFAGGPVGESPGLHGATLDDDAAYQVLDDSCRRDFARGFKLYKLYTRAAAFRKQRPQ